MSVILARRSMHPRACQCGHGENVHPLRLGGACLRLSCECEGFEPLQPRSLTNALDGRVKSKRRFLDQGRIEA